MLIEINPETRFAAELHARCIVVLEQILKWRKEDRENYIERHFRKKGQRYGFLKLFVQKEDETLDEYIKRFKKENSWSFIPSCLRENFLKTDLEPYGNFLELFNKGATFYITEKEYNQIK